MTKIPAHPKICDGSARLPRLGSLLSACLDVSFCLDKFFHRAVSSRYLVIVAFSVAQVVGSPREPSHSDLRVLQPTTSLKTRPQSLTRPPAAAGSGRANGSLIAKSGSRSPVAEAGLVNHRLSCPAKSFPALSGTAAKTDHHSSRRSRLVFSGLRGGIQFEGKSSRVGGAGQGRCSCDHSKAASRVHACVQRPAPEGFEGTSATGIEVTPPGTPGRGCSTRLLYLPHPFSTQGVWTRATLQKRFALPKDRPTADQST